VTHQPSLAPSRFRRARRAALAAVLLLAAAPTARSAPAEGHGADLARAEPAHSVELKVLSYNVKGLPLITDLDRLKRIGELLAERRRRGDEPDVVVLQEAFVRKARRVRKRAGYPYAIRGPKEGSLFANASGLEVLSNHPIVARYDRRLNDCAFPECLVAKAIVGVELALPGVPAPIQVFTTHLQADTRNDPVRRNQIDDLTVFLRRIPFGSLPAVFAGDFNFKPRHGSYHKFLREMPFADAGYDCLRQPEACQVVVGADGLTDWTDVWKTANDRHFYYQPAGSSVRIEPIRVIRNFTEPYPGGEGGFLSDHWGYEVHYRIRW
jgi:endonuclease/exonuclease/phosphatase family metal-dependent hydrolase